ncbi:MAG TPA: hypothetical protein PK095_04350 [Myxococcota bacterium]|nr:hypothetical protein [Myxococcota bacterium]
MRHLGLGVGAILWFGAAGLACDGPSVLEGEGGPQPEVPVAVKSPGLSERPWHFEWRPQLEALTPPDFDPAQAGLRCVDAISIDRGLLGIPVSGGGSGTSCFGGPWPTRYFTLTVNPDELVEVRVVLDAGTDETVWLVAQPDCDSRPADGEWQCGQGWVNASDGLVIQNRGAAPASWIIGARRLDHGAVAQTFDLEVMRQKPAPNASCLAAEPVSGPVFEVDPAGAGVIDDTSYKRALYFVTEVPPMTRATVRPTSPTHHYLFLQEQCDGERLNELYNRGETPMKALVAVLDVHGMDDPPFGAELVFEPVADEGFCGSPVRLEANTSVEVEPRFGGPAPEQCWCVASGRVIYVEVVVPAGSAVEVVGETGDETASVVLADQPEQCAAECGFQPAFGFEGSASLRLVNESDLDRAHHLIVESRAGWSGTSVPEDPPVRLTSRLIGRAPHLDGR